MAQQIYNNLLDISKKRGANQVFSKKDMDPDLPVGGQWKAIARTSRVHAQCVQHELSLARAVENSTFANQLRVEYDAPSGGGSRTNVIKSFTLRPMSLQQLCPSADGRRRKCPTHKGFSSEMSQRQKNRSAAIVEKNRIALTARPVIIRIFAPQKSRCDVPFFDL